MRRSAPSRRRTRDSRGHTNENAKGSKPSTTTPSTGRITPRADLDPRLRYPFSRSPRPFTRREGRISREIARLHAANRHLHAAPISLRRRVSYDFNGVRGPSAAITALRTEKRGPSPAITAFQSAKRAPLDAMAMIWCHRRAPYSGRRGCCPNRRPSHRPSRRRCAPRPH